MPAKKSEKDTAQSVDRECKVIFSKNTILHSAKYAKRRDLLSVLLNDGETYRMDQVDDLIANFMKKGKVK